MCVCVSERKWERKITKNPKHIENIVVCLSSCAHQQRHKFDYSMRSHFDVFFCLYSELFVNCLVPSMNEWRNGGVDYGTINVTQKSNIWFLFCCFAIVVIRKRNLNIWFQNIEICWRCLESPTKKKKKILKIS